MTGAGSGRLWRARDPAMMYPESGELVINDFRPGTDGGPPSDDLVVVDIATSSLIDRVPTGSRVANRMLSLRGNVGSGVVEGP